MAPGCILHIDDDENDRYFLERSAAEAGLHLPVVSLSSGEEGIEYLQSVNGYAGSRTPKPCLVLLDLKMPGMNGFEVIRWIRGQKHLQALPVIMLSSSSIEGDVEKAMKLGMNAFVSKPSTLEGFIKLMKAIDAFWFNFHEFNGTARCKSGNGLIPA